MSGAGRGGGGGAILYDSREDRYMGLGLSSLVPLFMFMFMFVLFI